MTRTRANGVRLALLGTFELECEGARVRLPMSAQRLVAFVALQEHPVLRTYAAGSLWPDTSDARAHANLRSALWRLHRCGHRVIDATGDRLRLDPAVRVDLHEAEALARRCLVDGVDLELEPSALGGDLLPDWYEEWVLLERERFRSLRLRALDALCERLMHAGRLDDALDAGHAAVAGEPLRESAHRALVRVHLAEGNTGEAIRQYRLFRRLLRDHLGLEPSGRMEELMRGISTIDTVR
ncbi:MAG TPA: BTAD domain-containing putative transcriptional regulator [Gaiellaceae bacterium]|nr:BTAD domain-containing putative transcriptional regulator [Gaiellaceae bacterium]